jgi:hypothetical protein
MLPGHQEPRLGRSGTALHRAESPSRRRRAWASHPDGSSDAGCYSAGTCHVILSSRHPHATRPAAEPGTGRRAALAVGASFSHRAQGGGILPDGAGTPDHQPQAPPPNQPGTRAGRGRQPGRRSADFVRSAACPWRPCGMLGVHRSPVPRAGQTARPGNRRAES